MALSWTAIVLGKQKITNHNQLQAALKDNTPPSGYIDLSYCRTETTIGNMPQDKQTYRLSFKDHFAFNLESKQITSVFDTVLNNSQSINGKPVLVRIPATVFVTSQPKTGYLRYQITVENSNKPHVKIYHCPWKRSVYLWH